MLVGDILKAKLQHPRAKETEFGHAHEPVNIQPGVVAGRGFLVATDQRPWESRGASQTHIGPAAQLAQLQSRDEIEQPHQAVDLVPGIPGQPFIGPLARQSHLIALGVDLAGQHQQGSAGGVDYRRFRSGD